MLNTKDYFHSAQTWRELRDALNSMTNDAELDSAVQVWVDDANVVARVESMSPRYNSAEDPGDINPWELNAVVDTDSTRDHPNTETD